MMERLARLRPTNTRILLLIALPLAITAINPNWIYNPDVLNDLDTWIYHGLFRYFFDFASTSPSDMHYFVERLSWVLPGYALHKVFTPVLANAILHLAVYYLGIFAFYGTARRLFGASPAFVAALCMGTYTWWVRAAGHDYLDGAGIAYFTAALWCAVEAASRERGRWPLFGSGAFIALALTTQLFWAAFVPVVAVVYLMLVWQRRRARIVVDGLWVAAGLAVVLAMLMLFNFVVFGRWNIFANSISFVRATAGSWNQIRLTYDIYTRTPATWIVLPALFGLCAAVCLVYWMRVAPMLRQPLRVAAIAFSLMTAVFCYFHFVTPFPYLNFYLYATMLIPTTFLLFAGLVAVGLRAPLTDRQALYAWLLAIAPFALIVIFELLEALRLNVYVVWLAVAVCAAIVAAGIASGRAVPVVGALTVMSFMFSGGTGVSHHDRLYFFNRFVAVSTIVNRIDARYPNDPQFRDFLVWYDPGMLSDVSRSVFGMSQPIFERAVTRRTWHLAAQQYASATRVILLSARDGAIDRMSEELGDDIEVQLDQQFTVPPVDPTGAYRVYTVVLRRRHPYGAALVPAGDNVRPPSLAADNTVSHTWTGPGEDVVMEFNLKRPRGDIVAEFCAILTILPPDSRIPASVNGVPVTFEQQGSTAACNPLYRAVIPRTAVNGSGVTEIAMTLPTAPADQVFHNGDMQLLGIAIRSMTFTIQDTP